jgi:hypothetical protein
VLLHQPPDLDRVRNVIGTIRVGVEGHLLAERLADQGNQRLCPPGERVGVLAQPATEAKLQGLRPALGDDLLEIDDFRFGRVAPVAAGPVDGDLPPPHPAEQVADPLARELAEQVQNGELGRRHADPEGEPLVLVVVVVAVEFPH